MGFKNRFKRFLIINNILASPLPEKESDKAKKLELQAEEYERFAREQERRGDYDTSHFYIKASRTYEQAAALYRQRGNEDSSRELEMFAHSAIKRGKHITYKAYKGHRKRLRLLFAGVFAIILSLFFLQKTLVGYAINNSYKAESISFLGFLLLILGAIALEAYFVSKKKNKH